MRLIYALSAFALSAAAQQPAKAPAVQSAPANPAAIPSIQAVQPQQPVGAGPGQQPGRGGRGPGNPRPFDRPNNIPVQAAPQPAQTVTIQLSADLATAIESARLNTKNQQTGQPLYPDIASMTKTLLGPQVRALLRQYPSAALKAKHAATLKAQQEEQAAEAAAVPK
jgi:hypothetical protein